MVRREDAAMHGDKGVGSDLNPAVSVDGGEWADVDVDPGFDPSAKWVQENTAFKPGARAEDDVATPGWSGSQRDLCSGADAHGRADGDAGERN